MSAKPYTQKKFKKIEHYLPSYTYIDLPESSLKLYIFVYSSG